MTGIILELQKEALDKNTRVSDLLRKGLLVSKKLKIPEMEDWLQSELNGYKGQDIPAYRLLEGTIKFHNPYHGWMPLMFPPGMAETHKNLSTRGCRQSISEIEELASNNTNGFVGMAFSPKVEAQLVQGADLPAPPMLLVSATRLLGIIDSVRNTILDWALTLEAEGIVGENLSFSDKEKAAASAIHINIGNAYNSPIQAGSISSSQIVNNLSYDIVAVKAFIEALEEKSNELELNSGQGSELSSEIQTIKAQIASPKPKSSIISASLSSIKTILEGAASSLTAEGLKKMIETLFT